MKRRALIAVAAIVTAPLDAKAVKIIQPIALGIAGANQVVAVDVTVGDSAHAVFDALEQKAAQKRTDAKLPPANASDAPAPTPETYETLPFARMFPLVIQDETRAWGLTGGRALRLGILVDTLKTANAGMAMLLGSNDELAGIVTLKDATSGETLGEFYVDVLNTRAGLLGLAMRGSGVREKLSAEFAKHVGEVLSGRKSKSAKPA